MLLKYQQAVYYPHSVPRCHVTLISWHKGGIFYSGNYGRARCACKCMCMCTYTAVQRVCLGKWWGDITKM